MHPALIQLGVFRLRGAVRRVLRNAKSLRGVLLLVFILAFFGLMLWPNLAMAHEQPRADPELVRSLAPLVLLAAFVSTLLTSSANKAVVFSMPEVEFLFPAPFTRRELLLYKLAGSVVGAGISALIFSVIFLRWMTWWIAGWIGLWLALLLIQLLSMAVTLVAQGISERAYSRSRRLVLVFLFLLAAVALWQALPSGEGFQLAELPTRFRASLAGQVVLAPFEVFGRSIAAETLVPDFLVWASAALAINLALTVLVLLLDANYLESAAVASEKRYEAVIRARQGQTLTIGSARLARWRFAPFPWLGGAGPTAWRQTLQFLRSSPRLIIILLSVAVFAGPGLLASRSDTADLTPWLVGMVAWVSFFLSSVIPTGFRADLDQMDALKTAPLSPLALVVGELLPAAILITLLQTLVLGGAAAFGVANQAAYLIAAIGFAFPVNLLLVTTENLLFLHYPARTVPASPGDLQFMARQILMLFVRMMLVLTICGIAGAAAGLAWLAGLTYWPLVAILGWSVLMVEVLGLILATKSAFTRFDPSLDMP